MITRESVIEVLRKVQADRCAYTKPNGERSDRCDCKFHKAGAPIHAGSESGNGCCELAWVIRHIENMTEKQLAKFLAWPLPPLKVRRIRT